MAIPNIVNVATIHAETIVGDLSTTLTTTLVTGEAEHVYKINVLRCTNVTDNDATVTIDIENVIYCMQNTIINFIHFLNIHIGF